jgi:hypothetical protein
VKLRRLAERLESWRKRTPIPRRLPEAIWKAAVDLAREHGVNPVAKALRLDYYSLKERLSKAPAGGEAEDTPEFVEVCLGKPVANAGWRIELQDGPKRRMTIAVPAGSPVDLATLTQAFWAGAS